MTKLGIIICDRYRRCAGGKCFRAVRDREGAFARYKGDEVEVVGYTSCDGCPGGNIEYAVDEMIGNGAEVIHLATGLIVGYPPAPTSAISTTSSPRNTASRSSTEPTPSPRSTCWSTRRLAPGTTGSGMRSSYRP